jgi:hypothetical protein
MKNFAWIIILGLSAVLLTDCIVAYPTVPPPALRVEVMLTRPGPAHVWIAGYWGWGGGGYHWVPGHWAKARRGRAWVDGRWEQKGRKWVWRRGHWK